MKYHINSAANTIGICEAQPGNCPFGGESEHFANVQDARDELERRFELTYGDSGLAAKQTKLVDSFDTYMQKKNGTYSEPAAQGLPHSVYVFLFSFAHVDSTEINELAKACAQRGLSYKEAQLIASELALYKRPLEGGSQVFLQRVFTQRLRAANSRAERLNSDLAQDPFHSSFRFRGSGDSLSVHTLATVGDNDYSIVMGSRGELSFVIYDHADGEYSRAKSPYDFIGVPQQVLQQWAESYNSKRLQLWERLMVEKERTALAARVESLES